MENMSLMIIIMWSLWNNIQTPSNFYAYRVQPKQPSEVKTVALEIALFRQKRIVYGQKTIIHPAGLKPSEFSDNQSSAPIYPPRDFPFSSIPGSFRTFQVEPYFSWLTIRINNLRGRAFGNVVFVFSMPATPKLFEQQLLFILPGQILIIINRSNKDIKKILWCKWCSTKIHYHTFILARV